LVFAFWGVEIGAEFFHEAAGLDAAVEDAVEIGAGDAEALANL
jgi:hypothetical protein